MHDHMLGVGYTQRSKVRHDCAAVVKRDVKCIDHSPFEITRRKPDNISSKIGCNLVIGHIIAIALAILDRVPG